MFSRGAAITPKVDCSAFKLINSGVLAAKHLEYRAHDRHPFGWQCKVLSDADGVL